MERDQLTIIRHRAVGCGIDFGNGNPGFLVMLRQSGVTSDLLDQYDLENDAFIPTDESRLFSFACKYFDNCGQMITPAVITEQMKLRRVPEAVITRYAMLLNEIKDEEPSRTGDLPYVIKRLKDYRAHHSAANLLMSSAQMLQGGDVMAAMNLVQQKASELLTAQSSLEPTLTYQEIIPTRIKTYDERVLNPVGGRGIPTGFYPFDKATGGLYPGDLLVVSGLPKAGKSVMLLKFVQNMFQHDRNVVFASGEMTTERVWERLDAMFTRLEATGIRFGRLNDDDVKTYKQILENLRTQAQGQIAVIPPDRCSKLSDIFTEVQALRIKRPIDCVIIDYIQLLEPTTTTRSDSDWEKIGRVAIEMARFGHQIGIPIVTASQIPEEFGKKTDDVFGLSRSRMIGHTAAAIWRIYKDEVIPDRLWVHIGAVRHGESGIKFALRADFSRMQIDVGLGSANSVGSVLQL